MREILIFLDGKVGKNLLQRIKSTNITEHNYTIIHNDTFITEDFVSSSNFTFYKFDSTSFFKLKLVVDQSSYSNVMVVLSNADDTIATLQNIKQLKIKSNIIVYDNWNLDFKDDEITVYRSIQDRSSTLLEFLPDVPTIAQNIGLKEGEIMQINISFGSSYAYRYIGSISQKNWKIFAIYRDSKLLEVKPSFILHPNDIILIVGQPDVLNQVYKQITKSSGKFPMPFGRNLYLYIDMYLQNKQEILLSLQQSMRYHTKIPKSKLIIKINRPSSVNVINIIKNEIANEEDISLEIEYNDIAINKIINSDKNRFDIGVIILDVTLFYNSQVAKYLQNSKIPILKIGQNGLSNIKSINIILNDDRSYEQMSPIVFDLSILFKLSIDIFNNDPLGESKREKLLSHFDTLAKIFNAQVHITSNNLNPIKQLSLRNNALQILPLKKEMFKKSPFGFLNIDSDIVSSRLKKHTQLLIPILE